MILAVFTFKSSTDMDWEQYSRELETIIAAIPMDEPRRILVNALMKSAKKQCDKEG